MKKTIARLGAAGAVAALSLAAFTAPAQAYAPEDPTTDQCGPVVNYYKTCTTADGWNYPVFVGTMAIGQAPAIAGVAEVGNPLTVMDAPWQPLDAVLTHQWFVGGTAVPGATGTTYTPAPGDLGQTITVETTGFKDGLTTPNTLGSQPTAAVIAAQPPVPVTTAPATVNLVGHPTIGSQLYAATGTWQAGATLQIQWLRNGVPIPGEVWQGHTLTRDDLGASISFSVTGYLDGYNPATVVSAATTPVTLYTPAPVVYGLAAAGSTLTATPQLWRTDSNLTFTYQWLRNGAPVTGATGLTYALTAADQGTAISLQQTGIAYDGSVTATVTTDPVPVAAQEKIVGHYSPVISGYGKVGYRLSASRGLWSVQPDRYAYRWFRNGAAIAGATASTYVLTGADQGKSVSVAVTASKAGYTSAALRSRGTLRIMSGSLWSSPARFSGYVRTGYTLHAVPGAWGPGRVTLHYQWLRNGAPIRGAVWSSYRLTGADRGRYVSLRVIGAETGYSSGARYSRAYRVR